MLIKELSFRIRKWLFIHEYIDGYAVCPIHTIRSVIDDGFVIKPKIREWLEENKIIYKSSSTDYVFGIIHFFRKEDAATYILLFNGKQFVSLSDLFSENRMLL